MLITWITYAAAALGIVLGVRALVTYGFESEASTLSTRTPISRAHLPSKREMRRRRERTLRMRGGRP